MSNQPEYENQQTETVTPEEVRQSILAEIEASKQAITELSDEQLEEVAGGLFGRGGRTHSGGGSAPGMMIPGTGMRPGGGSGSMLKQAAIWTVGGTLAQYGIGVISNMFSGGQSSGQSGSSNGQPQQ